MAVFLLRKDGEDYATRTLDSGETVVAQAIAQWTRKGFDVLRATADGESVRFVPVAVSA